MRSSSSLSMIAAFVAAAVFCVGAAWYSATVIERSSTEGVRAELDVDGITWADVDANGLQLFLIGTAPNEAARFDALSAAGRVVDAARVIDQMDVAEAKPLTPPKFIIEILRNDNGVSLIGLVPAATDRDVLVEDVKDALPKDTTVSDLLETASFTPPETWEEAMRFGIDALAELPRSKISIEAEGVTVTAMADSEESKRRLETDLARRKPDDVRLALDLSAPRPVITPFTLRFLIDIDGARFDACSAGTEDGRDAILKAAAAVGAEGKIECRIGLGRPSKSWPEGVTLGIEALARLGGGSLTFSDADISLVAAEGTDQSLFDEVVGELETALPDVFALTAVLPEPPDESDQGPPEFIATLSPEGEVQLRGRVSSEIARQTVDSYARANFGSDAVYTAARIDDALDSAWQVRVLAGMEALAQLASGTVTVTPDRVSVTGRTGNQNAKADISALLSDKLGEGERFDIAVTYVERLDPTLGIPTPEECEAQIAAVLKVRKITFDPGAATVDLATKDVLDEIAEILKVCREIPLEIQGHTDSQGREVMNEELSQQRAEAVLEELRNRRVLTASFRARGYGETQPIADNGTEEGREANRRIEFKLIRPETADEAETAEGDAPAAEEDHGNE